MKKLSLFLVTAFLFVACNSNVSVGEGVLVQWGGDDGWFRAGIDGVCEGGFYVNFENDFYDSSKSKKVCYANDEMVADKTPSARKIEVGLRLLAEDEGSFYPASVVEINDDIYTIAYLSNANQVDLKLDQLRLLPE